jgi:LAO/AO transport system kinase
MKKARATDAPTNDSADALTDASTKESTVEPAGWSIPVLKTNALTNEGVGKLLEAVEEHRLWLESSGQLEARRRARAAGRIRDVVDRELRRVAWKSEYAADMLDQGVERIATGRGTPYSAARKILSALLRPA